MSRVLLVNPPSAVGIYNRSKIRVAITSAPFITLATLAGELLREDHQVRIADLMVEEDPFNTYRGILEGFQPEYIGITFTTPLFHEAAELAGVTHELLPESTIIAGGIHASTLPQESLEKGNFDLVVLGEGERTLADICAGTDPQSIRGIAFGRGDEFTVTPERELIADLDDLPLPAWELHDLTRYRSPHIASRENPVGYMETNR
ncbi:MAG: cobalamin-dependent protein, partial [Candidatus Aegiribacteria sp.]|nr:cobalamin-dependent protein [Candidatus Aegiribacteria sp.]